PRISDSDPSRGRHPVLARVERVAEATPLVEPEEENRRDAASHIPSRIVDQASASGPEHRPHEAIEEQADRENDAAIVEEDGEPSREPGNDITRRLVRPRRPRGVPQHPKPEEE